MLIEINGALGKNHLQEIIKHFGVISFISLTYKTLNGNVSRKSNATDLNDFFLPPFSTLAVILMRIEREKRLSQEKRK